MHVHFRDPSRNLKMDIANGVLGIRNMGGAPKDAFPLREAIAGGYAGSGRRSLLVVQLWMVRTLDRIHNSQFQ